MKGIYPLPLFKDFDRYSPKYHFFKSILLGQVHDPIPWDDLVACLKTKPSRRGACWFGGKGIFALMFLKAYLNVSDRQLLGRYNPDWSLQYFCGKVLADNQQIKEMTNMTRILLKNTVNGKKYRRFLSVTGSMMSTTAMYF
ncbi:hypothetical protein [Anditalea andensis]|nr:hypothetical protein [Anditalea andensis]